MKVMKNLILQWNEKINLSVPHFFRKVEIAAQGPEGLKLLGKNIWSIEPLNFVIEILNPEILGVWHSYLPCLESSALGLHGLK